MRQIRIANAEARKNRTLLLFHRFGFGLRFVIVTQEVEKSMHGKMGEVMSQRLSFALRFARDRLIGDRDVTEMNRTVALQRGWSRE